MREGNLPIKEFVRDTLSAIRMSGKRCLLSGGMTVWGVFIFVVIVGASNGVDRGNKSNYDYFIQCGMISVYPGEVSKPVNGLAKGRKITFNIDDADKLKSLLSNQCEDVYPRLQFTTTCSGITGSSTLIVSDFREGLDEKFAEITAGSPLSKTELVSNRRVCLLPEMVSGQLFGGAQEAIGETLNVNGIPFVIRGVYKDPHNLLFRSILIPFHTAMSIRGKNVELTSIDVKLSSEIPAIEKYWVKDKIHTLLCVKKRLDPNDPTALRIEEGIDFVNSQEHFFSSLRLFTGTVGVLSLLMGIIGISSIIHISVKERKREIAIRLVCGSTEISIFALVLGEAVMTMFLFGLAGIILASGVLAIATSFVEKMNEGVKWIMIGDMNVSWSLIGTATLLIIFCGIIAGFAPAKKAVSINVSEALSQE